MFVLFDRISGRYVGSGGSLTTRLREAIRFHRHGPATAPRSATWCEPTDLVARPYEDELEESPAMQDSTAIGTPAA